MEGNCHAYSDDVLFQYRKVLLNLKREGTPIIREAFDKKRKTNMQRRILLITLLIIVFVITSCGTPVAPISKPSAVANKPDQVVFSLDWVVSGRHAPYFTALDKGYYADENISVTIVRGYNSTDSIKQVASGRSQFAFADIGTLILARANDGVNVKAVAVIYAKAPHFFFCNADAGINTPNDLVGHTIGAPAGNSHRVLFPVFAKLNNFDPTKVNWVTLDASLLSPSLFSKKVDCIPEYFSPLLEKQAADANFHYSILRFSDFGMNFYSNSIIVSEETIAKNPDLVHRFVRATLKGLQYSFDHPDEAVDILQRYHPEVDNKAVAVQEIGLVQLLAMSDEAKLNGLGYMDALKIKDTLNLISGAFGIATTVKPDDLYTDTFLPTK
jgi:NitT/TauT family transport system substrate-binding protein